MGDLLSDERSEDDYIRVEIGQWEGTLQEAVMSLPEREARILAAWRPAFNGLPVEVVPGASAGMALETLGYSAQEIEQIEAYINDKGTIIGAPGRRDHRGVGGHPA